MVEVYRAFFKKLGSQWLDKPKKGRFPSKDEFPSLVRVRGKNFVKSTGISRHGSVAHYREDAPTDSDHMYVLPDRKYVIDHKDRHNPHTSPIKHLMGDMVDYLRHGAPKQAK